MTHKRAEEILGVPVAQHRWRAGLVILPQQAEAILAAQPRQRPINKRNLNKLCADIAAGNFRRTHQGIAFDQDGFLSDGQHRLTACAQTGVAIEVEANFNEPRELFRLYDKHTGRDVPTDLLLAGVLDEATSHNRSSIVSAARFLWAYDQGHNPVYASTLDGWNSSVAQSVILAHPLLTEVVIAVRSVRGLRLPSGPLGAIGTMMREADAARGQKFLQQVLTGENIASGDPAYTLRENAITRRGSVVDAAYRIARAWNAFYAGRTLLKIYGSSSASGAKVRTADPFPEIAGYTRPGSAPRVAHLRAVS